LAFVARSELIAEVCRALQQELAPLGCELAVFAVERQALEWLREAEPQARRAPPCRALAFQ
jgi:hypothetical protein